MGKLAFEVVHNIPSPYRLHLFRELWRQLSERGIDFHVNFMALADGDRPEAWKNPKIEFPHSYWPDLGYGCHHFNPTLIRYLRNKRPDFLMVGSLFETFTSAIVSCFCPVGVKCAWVEGQTKTPGSMDGWKGGLKRWLLSQHRFVAVPGSDGRDYIRDHQKRTKRQLAQPVILPNLIDETVFRPRRQWPADEISRARSELCRRSDDRLCLIPARIEAVKGLIPFVNCLNNRMLENWTIGIIGQGSQKDLLVDAIRSRGLSDHFVIKGYMPYSDMPKIYAAADLFLLPSIRDQNPLSVAEALHSGLPVALSDRSGNVEEAVNHGVNGWRLPVLDLADFASVLSEVFATSAARLEEMGRASVEKNAKFWCTTARVREFLDAIGAR